MSRKTLSERMIVEIIMRHKEKILQDGEEQAMAQKDINRILDTLIKKTGRDMVALRAVKKDNKYQIILEIK